MSPSPPTTKVVLLKSPFTDPLMALKIDCTKASTYPGCMNSLVFFRRPDVPGLCPGNGFTETVVIFSSFPAVPAGDEDI
jgi:hypothetical protein